MRSPNAINLNKVLEKKKSLMFKFGFKSSSVQSGVFEKKILYDF